MAAIVRPTGAAPALARLIGRHLSFFIILAGAAATYAVNVGLAYAMSPPTYINFSLFMSFALVATTYASFGIDQVKTRCAKIDRGTVLVSNSYSTVGAWASAAYAVLSAGVAAHALGPSAIAPAIVASIAASVLINDFTAARLNGRFSIAQLHKNSWKLFLAVPVALLVLANETVTTKPAIWGVALSLAIAALVGRHPRFRSRLIYDPGPPIDYRLWFEFSLSMLIVTALTHADRFVLAKNTPAATLASYLFFQNLILGPLSQLQNYFGFKELNHFKADPSLRLLHSSLARAAIIGFSASVFGLILLMAVSAYLPFALKYKMDAGLATLLALTGCARLAYSVLSAAMGALASSAMIARANLVTLISGAALITIGLFFGPTPKVVCTAFASIWLIRSCAFYREITGCRHEV